MSTKPWRFKLPLTQIAMLQSGAAQPWSLLGSLILIMSGPVVAVFMLLQRRLLDRMMFGLAND